jgi:hypothetical protein
MNLSIPSMTQVRAALKARPYSELKAAADAAGLPYTTAWRIANGDTPNPGVETVRRLLSQFSKVAA